MIAVSLDGLRTEGESTWGVAESGFGETQPTSVTAFAALLTASPALDVRVHPGGEGGFVEGSGGEVEQGLRGVFFGSSKAAAVYFEEEDSDDKAGALVPIDEGVVADNACGVCSSHVYDIQVVPVGMELLRPGKGGLKEAGVADALSAAVESEKAVMKREGVPLIYPDGGTHLESACSVLR
jgi:hypothetical protein